MTRDPRTHPMAGDILRLGGVERQVVQVNRQHVVFWTRDAGHRLIERHVVAVAAWLQWAAKARRIRTR